MQRLLAICLVLFSSFLFSQQDIHLTVLDQQTKEALPFVKMIHPDGKVVMSDIDGKIATTIQAHESYVFRFFDYRDTTYSGAELLTQKKGVIVLLTPDSQVFDEVVIRPGENPAHRIMRNAMNQRKNNDPLRNNSFKYDAFSKFLMTAEAETEILRDTITDTSKLRLLELLDEQYFFLSETASTRTFSPPNYDKEEVTSYKVSGVNNPLFSTLVNQFQSFSFYDNIFSINDKDYINPIAPGGLNRYLFILEDTLFHETNDTTFTISFRPKKGKNFEGMKGYLYIHTNGWAIERVIAEPYEASPNFNIRIVQEYKFTNNTKWFPHKLSTEIELPGVFINNHHAIGKANLYINNVVFDIDTGKSRFNPIKMEVKEDALNDTTGLRKARGTASTEKELRTYQVVDSIGKEQNFDKLIEAISIASTGKIPIKKISLPVQRIIDFNQQEGYRVGIGIETNRRFSKHIGLGGYFAYGFRDESWKWGGNLDFTLHQARRIKLQFLYQDDVFERGGIDYNNDEFDLTTGALYRNFFINQMDRQRKAAIGIGGYVTPNFKLNLFGNYRRVEFFDEYAYVPLFEGTNPTFDAFDIAETGAIITWNIREKIMLLGEERVSMGRSKFPKLTFKGVRGMSSIFESAYDYYRLNLTLEQNFTIRGFGRLSLLSSSGMTIGNVPLTLQQMPFGTGKNWNLTVPNTFETMAPAEFFSERQTALFSRLTFLPLKNNTSWTEPLISLHNAAGFGQMDNRSAHFNSDFKVHDQGYFETGVIIDNLLKFGFNGFGIGVFHRYGPYAFEDMSDNFVYKLSLKFNF